MKKLLLIALMVSGLVFVPMQRSDAQISVGIGVGSPGGYYGYPGYGYSNNPYGYSRPYPYYGGYYGDLHTTGPVGTGFIPATIVTITTDTKVTRIQKSRLSWLESNFGPAAVFKGESFPCALLFWISGLRRFGRGTFGRLVNLELFLQLLNQRR